MTHVASERSIFSKKQDYKRFVHVTVNPCNPCCTCVPWVNYCGYPDQAPSSLVNNIADYEIRIIYYILFYYYLKYI